MGNAWLEELMCQLEKANEEFIVGHFEAFFYILRD